MSEQAFINMLKEMMAHHEKLLGMYEQLRTDPARMTSSENQRFLDERITEEKKAIEGITLTLNDYLSISSME